MSSLNIRLTLAIVVFWPILVATMDKPSFGQIVAVGVVLFIMSCVADFLDFYFERRKK